MVAISHDASVAFVELNQVARTLVDSDRDLVCESGRGRTQTGLFGLRRISHHTRNPSPDASVLTRGGADANIYIIDTGIRISHNDFGGRAEWGMNCADSNNNDGNGHGTHCASTAGGTEYGVAENSRLVAVKVLNDGGSGTFACVIQGIDWTAARANSEHHVIGSLSLGGGFSAAVNAAVDGAVDNGAAMSSASGNSNANACNSSPASAAKGVCVNSHDINDARSSFSNWGTCTDIFAAGTNVLGAWVGSDSDSRTISGTSMACPHVTGVIAETWEDFPTLTAAQVQAQVILQGADGTVSNPGTGSPNNLALSSCTL